MEKKGQVTIFIIVGILIVSSIALFFLFRGNIIPEIGGKSEQNPNIFLESCIEDKIREGIDLISIHGGYIENPLNIYFKFEDENSPQHISYLCYNQEPYALCVNQEPMLIKRLEDEIYDYISGDVRICFDDLTSSLEKQGHIVDASYGSFDVDLAEGKVIIEVDGEIVLTKTGETTKQEDFSVIIPSKLYDLARVVQEIVNKEAIVGEFGPTDMGNYPDFEINEHRTRDSSVIYLVKHKESNEEFRFAVRGAVIPSGFGMGAG
ncbi:hypothetical protein KAJ87_02735 [Candidatus Pacearchaeota archaeon]|nr:hypothetical protein [Candidatus Pacearchaeota archaeon]